MDLSLSTSLLSINLSILSTSYHSIYHLPIIQSIIFLSFNLSISYYSIYQLPIIQSIYFLLFNLSISYQSLLLQDSTHLDEATNAVGDGDPIDAIELGDSPLPMGAVVAVRLLGSLALVDEGETDHKLLVVRVSDDKYRDVRSVRDLERLRPGVTARLVDWLKNYKTSDGKAANTFSQEEPTSAAEAARVVQQVHGAYRSLLAGEVSGAPEDYFLPQ